MLYLIIVVGMHVALCSPLVQFSSTTPTHEPCAKQRARSHSRYEPIAIAPPAQAGSRTTGSRPI
eukprot:scaffold19037_cov135-Isochrysis_galbana.AAC.2